LNSKGRKYVGQPRTKGFSQYYKISGMEERAGSTYGGGNLHSVSHRFYKIKKNKKNKNKLRVYLSLFEVSDILAT